MIGKMIHGLETIREHFLFKDCKKMLKKYYGRKQRSSGKNTGKMRIGSSISTVVQQ